LLRGAIDVHCHVIETPTTLDRIADLPVQRLIVMGTQPDDWHLVEETLARFPGRIVPAFGVHPWHAERALPPHAAWAASAPGVGELASGDEVDDKGNGARDTPPDGLNGSAASAWLARLRSLLKTYPQAIVGEIGLDGVATDGRTGKLYPMEQQLPVFDAQMAMAIALNRPVSIHAVHVHGRILEYFRAMDQRCGRIRAAWKQDLQRLQRKHRLEGNTTDAAELLPPPRLPCPPAIMMHSFTASPDIGRSLVRLPCIGSRFFFSFSMAVNARSKKFSERVQAIPDDRLLVESDLHDTAHVAEYMVAVCRAVADIRGWTVDETIRRTTQNADAFLAS
ncbi:hypothetical protein BC831DRAFT_392205, partial [Entophlyctis helioformis]